MGKLRHKPMTSFPICLKTAVIFIVSYVIKLFITLLLVVQFSSNLFCYVPLIFPLLLKQLILGPDYSFKLAVSSGQNPCLIDRYAEHSPPLLQNGNLNRSLREFFSLVCKVSNANRRNCNRHCNDYLVLV